MRQKPTLSILPECTSKSGYEVLFVWNKKGATPKN